MITTDPNQIVSPEEGEQQDQQMADERALIDEVWSRYEYGRDRGHTDYCATAIRNENFYLGGGLQWDEEDRRILENAKRPVTEINEIFVAVNSAGGYQINNRMDVTCLPRGGDADEESAEVFTKVIKQILDNNDYRWVESDVFEDGLIEQRGYFDVRVRFDDSLLAEAEVSIRDPRDVIPDPDAKSYDPKKWADVTVSGWMLLDEVEQLYGLQKRLEVEKYRPSDQDHGDDSSDERRNKFGDGDSGGVTYDAWMYGSNAASARVRVVERQYWRYVESQCALMPTGDVRVIEGLSPQKIDELVANGAALITRKMRRVRWTVATKDVLLHDDWSPFSFFTIIPYFPYFRRGKTRGMVDNAISPQETLNKAMSSILHTVNQTANSGWITWEDTLVNMDEQQLRADGAKPGLHIQVSKDTPADKIPKKIEPNQIPAGYDRIIEHSRTNLKAVTLNDELTGKAGEDMSGIAIQSRQFAAQQGSLAKPLDNLARTRHMLVSALIEIVQKFYDDARIMRIRQVDKETGKEYDEEFSINMPQPDGSILNDMTLGEYDVVIANVPVNATFENGAFQQGLEMKKLGVAIPDSYLIKNSTLPDKGDIIEAMQGSQQPDPLTEAKVELVKAQTEKTKAEAVVKNVEGIFSATEAAQNIAVLPQVAPLADDILGSSGYIDKDGPPLVPPIAQIPAESLAPVPEPQKNTNPLTPVNPGRGMMAGIEGGQGG